MQNKIELHIAYSVAQYKIIILKSKQVPAG